jgi:KaiC/GvpD/RAD55 family RecA-like ATPase
MEGTDIGELLKEKLDELPEPFIFLVVTPAEEYQTVNFELLKYMVNEKKTPGVYITVNKPYEVMKKRLEGVADARMVTFIDAVTRASGGKPEEEDGVLYIDSPKNLTDISIAISEAAQSIPQGKKFILFDTLSTLLLYNSAGTVARFVHFLIGRMRSWGAEGALLSLEKETGENVISQISQFCDATIYIGKE